MSGGPFAKNSGCVVCKKPEYVGTGVLVESEGEGEVVREEVRGVGNLGQRCEMMSRRERGDKVIE